MARLIVRTDGFGERVIELRLGVNRLGRSPENDFQIEHNTVSATHCMLKIEDGELLVQDCDSTNGTFVAGEPISEARLGAGQSFRMGDVELLVENTEMTVAIPQIEVKHPKPPPVVLTDGSLLCPRHPRANVTHQCTRCKEVMCEACVRGIRRRGGKMLKLCPVCSNKVEPIGGEKKKKRSLVGFLQKTVKLPFFATSKHGD